MAARLGRQTVALGALLMIAGLVLLDLGVSRIGGTAAGGHGSVLWLVPGLVVDGAGMGLIIAPLAALVLSRVAPQHAGAASGVLSMVMQFGGALGVALIGIIFYGAASGGSAPPARALGDGFTEGSYLLIGIAAAVMIGIQLLPRRAPN